MKKIISMIPARGGSTEIPLKNLVAINKKPMLHYTVNASLGSKFISRTFVTTDNKKIANTARKLGAEVINRPKKLSGNKIGIEPAMEHVLRFLKNKENYVPDIIILLQNTSPLRNSKHIDEAIQTFNKKKIDSLLSAYRSHYFFWTLENNKLRPKNYNPLNRPNRQQVKREFIENGAIYITKLSAFKKTKCRVSGKIGVYEMPVENSYEVDTRNDLFIIEQMIKNRSIQI